MRDKNRHIGGQPTGRGRIGALSAILGPAFVVVGLILGLYSAAATAKSPVPPSAEATSSSTATKAGAKTKTGATTKTSTAKSAAAVKAKTGATKKASVPKRAAKSAPAKKATKKVVRYMPKGTFAVFATTHGTFRVELYPQYAPRTVENFIQLVEGKKVFKSGHKTKKINYPFYKGLTFHRVVSRFMIQGGCPKGTGRGGPGYTFADEFSPYLKHDKPGVLSMANSGPDSNGSQFFITVAAAPWLNNKHSIFGRVTEGYSVVEKISEVRTDKNSKPLSPVKINSIKIIRNK